MEKMIVINQKMYLNSKKEIHDFQNRIWNYKDKLVILPSYIYLDDYINMGFIVGSQNVSDENIGAYTGEVSIESLADMGISYVMIGHAETRKKYPNDNIKRKIEKAIDLGLKVILCIGEDRGEDVFKVIDKELEGISENIIISYEPIWAIGKGITPSKEELTDIIKYIKSKTNSKVLYGGSVSDDNIEILNSISELDGFLLGSGALKDEVLRKIIEVVLG